MEEGPYEEPAPTKEGREKQNAGWKKALNDELHGFYMGETSRWLAEQAEKEAAAMQAGTNVKREVGEQENDAGLTGSGHSSPWRIVIHLRQT